MILNCAWWLVRFVDNFWTIHDDWLIMATVIGRLWTRLRLIGHLAKRSQLVNMCRIAPDVYRFRFILLRSLLRGKRLLFLFFHSIAFRSLVNLLVCFYFLFHTACWFLVKEKNTLCAKELMVTNVQACRAAFDCATVPGKSPDAFADVFFARSDPHSPQGCVRHDLGHRGGVWIWNTHATGGKPSSFISPICRKCNHTVVY